MVAPILVQNLVKEFSTPSGAPYRVVDEISFEVHEGECLGLLGPNGAGKTTTIRCLSGQIAPSAGDLFLRGISVQREPRLARRHLGMVPQFDAIEADCTVEEQLFNYGLYFGISRAQVHTRTRELLEQFELREKAKDYPQALSGGMKRRLMLARALLPNPSILILDEPTSGLDPHARQSIWAEIQSSKNAGRSVLLSTHYMSEAERLCDRIALLDAGRIIALGSPQELIQRHIECSVIQEELRPGIWWGRPPNLEDVFLKMTGRRIDKGGPS